MRVKATVTVKSPIEVTVDIPKDVTNREGIITYLQGVTKEVLIGNSKLDFEVLNDIRG